MLRVIYRLDSFKDDFSIIATDFLIDEKSD